ncbi:hypothetical protein PHYSODRAFT_324562 [Phytophthora sojae]|uniref:Uncharacterized protein n=1 Tax=Phytophthora sojae (strain P6497) TaxID=1094619 RepID=G4YZX2_PHYSP|nr:hypothetical protein PHYSODRAFT_324562 [Phytophthora sojae]EGZ23335.1 hypothetical protein PHYSODRAFT_324562 [Phytophthora sojae]|eukprot:XP_009518623.1 hypothetical protein PHYSODRAFT_324562 [Phytophthora sojae]
MVPVRPIKASCLFGFALLVLSAAEDAQDGWKSVHVDNITEADSSLLYKARVNTSTYAPGVTKYGCVFFINGLEIKSAEAVEEGGKIGVSVDSKNQSAATNYHFSVDGCPLEPGQTERMGKCGAMMCVTTNFEIYITSEALTNTLTVTAVTAEEGEGLGMPWPEQRF